MSRKTAAVCQTRALPSLRRAKNSSVQAVNWQRAAAPTALLLSIPCSISSGHQVALLEILLMFLGFLLTFNNSKHVV